MLQLIHQCVISRNVQLGSNGRHQQSVVSANVACLALPMDARAAVTNDFSVGKAWDFFFDLTTDVRVGDRLSFDGSTYSVAGVRPYSVPVVGHKHALCTQENA